MKTYTSKSIAKYLTQFDNFGRAYLNDETICIDRKGTLHTLSADNVRKFNDAYGNTKEDEFFGEKISFIANYISFHIARQDDKTIFSCDICNEHKPTKEQVEKLFNVIKRIKKLYSDCVYVICWRWVAGGGYCLSIRRTPNAITKQITKALDENKDWVDNGSIDVKYWDYIAKIKGEN